VNHVETAFYVNLGRAIRVARKAAGRSQQEIADALEISRSTVAMIETGRQADDGFVDLDATSATGTAASDRLVAECKRLRQGAPA
jgi:transcriptional regulator with XRE-family HTH domain